MNKWTGSERAAVEHILAYGKVKPDEYQLGNTKIFIKEPASVSHLGELTLPRGRPEMSHFFEGGSRAVVPKGR